MPVSGGLQSREQEIIDHFLKEVWYKKAGVQRHVFCEVLEMTEAVTNNVDCLLTIKVKLQKERRSAFK